MDHLEEQSASAFPSESSGGGGVGGVHYTIEPTLTYNDIVEGTNNTDEDNSYHVMTQPTHIADNLGKLIEK